MKIFVQAKPRAREELVTKINETHYTVAVKEPPIKGKANFAVMKALAVYFAVPLSSITLISGHTSRQKVFEVERAET